MGYVLCFAAGMIIGAVAGVAVMALCAASGKNAEGKEC